MAIKNKILMVSLTVNKPQLTKTDRKGTAAAEDALDAKGAGKFVKQLYPKHLIDPIVQVEQEARAYLYSNTRMWLKGVYLLPAVRYMPFAEQMGKYELAFNQSVTAFMNNINKVMTAAQESQGAMFDPSEYPDLTALRAEFSFNPRYFPFADVGDFNLDGMEQEEVEALKADARQQYAAAFAESHKELYGKLFAAVQRIVTQTGKEKGRIYDTLTSDLEHLIEVLPALNFDNDQNLNEIIEECRSIAVDPDMLREEENARKRVHNEAQGVLAKMAEFM
jgi:hypothetical protein